MNRSVFFLLIISTILTCQPNGSTETEKATIGQLRVGFDIDDTIVFSRDNFQNAQKLSEDPGQLDYGWINTHDSLYSSIIQPMAELIAYYRAQGHEVYFITARPGTNGEAVGRYLSQQLGFKIMKGKNLFFAPKERDPVSGKKYTTKHRHINRLGLHIYFGDSDMVAASIAGVRAVRVVRDQRSVDAYSSNYIGDMKSKTKPAAPFDSADYLSFLSGGVGPYGETIYPIFDDSRLPNPQGE